MATWDDSELEDEDSDEEHANVALMARTITNEEKLECELIKDDESDSKDEVEIIYVADVLDGTTETLIMAPGQWMLSTHDGPKEYVPRFGT